MKPPVVTAIGAAVTGAGVWGATVAAPVGSRACSGYGASPARDVGVAFVSRCLGPGIELSLGICATVLGGMLLVHGAWRSWRSWGQRTRQPPAVWAGWAGPARPDARWAGREVAGLPAASWWGAVGTQGAASPPPGWYRPPPDNVLMWWDGRSWDPAPDADPVARARSHARPADAPAPAPVPLRARRPIEWLVPMAGVPGGRPG